VKQVRFVVWTLLTLVMVGGCASGPDPVAYKNRVFYEGDAGADVDLKKLLEKPWPPLDWTGKAGREHEGIEIMGGVARISRPKDWVIRRGSIRPEGRFIEYVSPRQVVFAVYERLESPTDPWTVVLDRYQADTREQGGEFLGPAVPHSTFNASSRAFDVRRGVPVGKEPLVSFSREYVARSSHRIVLVQIVRPREDYGEAQDELLRIVQSMIVL